MLDSARPEFFHLRRPLITYCHAFGVPARSKWGATTLLALRLKKNMKTHQIFAAVPFLVCCSACAALDIAIEEPLEVMQANAAAGDPSAQYNLALACQDGRGVSKDPARALEWYRKAAAAGFMEAQFNLGVLLINGVDVPKDEKEAARWFYAAAQNGSFEAQRMLVQNYSAGRGVEKSPAKALAWDMLARRTLELRYGGYAGRAPKPGALRADGAAEMVGKDGKKEWVLPDGSRETIDEAGVRHIDQKNGCKTTVQPNGGWETLYPNGVTEEVTVQGRKTLRDGKGQSEITDPDGSRIMEGDGLDNRGAKVRIRDTFGPDGKRLSHRVTTADSTYEERADNTRILETKVKRDDGVELILSEEIATDGTQGKGKVRRADTGITPKDTEIWAILRTLNLRGGVTVEVLEKYSEAGFYSQVEVKRVAENVPRPDNRPSVPMLTVPPRTPSPMLAPESVMETFPTRSLPVIPPPGINKPITFAPTTGSDDPTAFAPETDIDPKLAELKKIELDAHNFAGATAADYERARATAEGYVIPLANAPQRAAGAPAWLRERTITQSTLHEAPLLPILDDRSKQFPLGPHGAELIKAFPWKHAETEHFIVHYRGEAEARLTVQYIEGAYTVLTQLLNLDPQRGQARTHVFVFPEAEWKTYLQTKGHPPELAGFAYKTELLLGAATNREDRAESIKVLCHEVTHALIARFYPGRKLPLWMNEGLAEYIALRTMRTMRTKGVAMSTPAGASTKAREDAKTRLIGKPDAQMDVDRLFIRIRYGNKTTPDRMAAFYSNSQKCVQVLFEKLPVEGFSTFFNTLAAGNRPEAAFGKAFGKQCDSTAAFKRLVNGS